MANVVRQPFAPLDGARLQNLTSIKNRQNAASPLTGKRKAADIVDSDDFENVDPTFFSKRSKGAAAGGKQADTLFKPSAFVLTKAAAPALAPAPAPVERALAAPSARNVLFPKSPAAKLNTSLPWSSPLSAPAGRSPTRSKRAGISSSRRRTIGPYSRVDPPTFGLSSTTPFSLDAALKGTLSSYAARTAVAEETPLAVDENALPIDMAAAPVVESFAPLNEPDAKSSWFFDIHEDTPEQEMTNLLQHSTCVLDISSDEESKLKARQERLEGRDKENVPPADDVSQTSSAAARRARTTDDDMVVEKERVALGEMRAEDFYAAGCDETSVVLIPEDDDEAQQPEQPQAEGASFEFAPQINLEALEPLVEQPTVDELMSKDEPAQNAAVLEPIEGTGESFDLWESGSAKDEGESLAVVAEAR